jgi:hypothetical protein
MVEQRLPVSLVAMRTGVPLRSLYHYIKTGRLKASQVRGIYYVRVADGFMLAERRRVRRRSDDGTFAH